MRHSIEGTCITYIFDSVQEYADFAAGIPNADAPCFSMDGGSNPKQGAHNIVNGVVDSELLSKAHALLDKIDSSFRERTTQQWEPSMAGAYPMVPEYLMGIPDNMRERRDVPQDAAPLDMYIEAAIAGGVSGAELAARGAAVAAFIMRVSEERPVSLTFLSHNELSTVRGYRVHMRVPLDTNPVSLTQVLSIFAVAQTVRAVRFAAIQQCLKQYGKRFNTYNESMIPDWGNYVRNEDMRGRDRAIRARWGINEKAIVVQRGNYEDSSLMLSDPVEWVHKQLEKQRTVE